MAGMNMPDLAQMEFLPPYLHQEAMNRVGLSNQFANQELASGAQDLQTKVLSNLFQQQNDPQKLQKTALENTGLQNANTISGVNAEVANSTRGEQIKAKRMELLAKASDDELKQLQTQAIKEYESDDPKLRAIGEKKLMASKAEFDRRNKQTDEMDKVKLQGANAKEVANIHAGATLGAAQIGANARTTAASARAKGVADFDQAVAAGKITPAKAAVYFATKAQSAQDPEEQAFLFSRAAQFEKLAQATSGAPKTGVDVPAAAGMPAMQAPSAFGPRPQPAAPAAGSKPALPPGWTMK